MKKYFYHILDLNLKRSYQIASLFHMYIDMGERTAARQDRPSLIIEGPPTYVSTVMKSAPLDFMEGPNMTRKKMKFNFCFIFFFFFKSKGSYQKNEI